MPNPKCRLFLKIDQYLVAGVSLSEALNTITPVTHCTNTCTPVLIHTGKRGGYIDEPVRGYRGASSQEGSKIPA
jgi:hypothetical protein